VLVLAIACVVSAAAWLYLVAAHGGFWLTSQRLPPVGSPAANAEPGAEAGPGLATWPAVAAVVPARNEAESLPETLPALLEQDYPGEFRVFLVDDNSEDGTGAIARRIGDPRLSVLGGTPRPDGWAGKLWALRQGVATSDAAEYFLLTDADIEHDPPHLASLVAAAERHDLDMVSEMVALNCDSWAERTLIPAPAKKTPRDSAGSPWRASSRKPSAASSPSG
jgi:cellulose synthase/poly-beta-1,6-N-acetylglucosamine synthase-like glycosyltransferase